MPSNAASSISGPISVSASRGSPTFTWPNSCFSRATSSSATLSWTISRRSVVQRWPAVPAAENRIARAASSRSALGADDHRIVAAELEQHAPEALRDARARPRGPSRSIRSPRPARCADRRPEPRRRRARPGPAAPARPAHRRSRAARGGPAAITASAHSGVFSLGFQITGLPQTSASAAFHAHTATGKLKALITSTGPSGCHCSIIRWFGPLAGDGQAVELARQADREVADVDHLLDFAEALLDDLAGFERDQSWRAARLRLAQLFAEQPHQLAAARRRHRPPFEEGRGGAAPRRDRDRRTSRARSACRRSARS